MAIIRDIHSQQSGLWWGMSPLDMQSRQLCDIVNAMRVPSSAQQQHGQSITSAQAQQHMREYEKYVQRLRRAQGV